MEGVETIFAHSVAPHGKYARTGTVMSDTTVQGNNVTLPTDAKLDKKVIDKCNKIAEREGVRQRQSYKRTSRQLVRDTYNGKHAKRAKKAKKSLGKLRTIAGRLVRELERKLPGTALAGYGEELDIFKGVLAQQRGDRDKTYSLHKPHTACTAKGKAGKQYEFGNKVGIMATMGKRILITAVEAFTGNPHDGTTIAPLLGQHRRLHGHCPGEVVYDRGGRVKGGKVGETTVSIPGPPLKRDTDYQKRKRFRRRAAIEPVIGHLKKDFRMQENYLMGENGPKVNAMLAATGWNLKKPMEKLVEEILSAIFNIMERALRMFFKPVFATS